MKFSPFALLGLLCFVLSFAACSASPQTEAEFGEYWKTLYFTEKKTEQAKTFCERWLDHETLSLQSEARICLASIAVYEDNENGFAAARAQIDAALKNDPQNFDLHVLRLNLNVYYQTDFTADLENTLSAFPNAAAAEWLPPLDAWFKMQEYAAIQSYLTLLDKRYPDNPDVLGHLGMIHFFQDDIATAETLLSRGIALSPDNASLIWNLARIYEIKNENGKAKISYEKALSLVSDDDESAGAMHCLYAHFLF